MPCGSYSNTTSITPHLSAASPELAWRRPPSNNRYRLPVAMTAPMMRDTTTTSSISVSTTMVSRNTQETPEETRGHKKNHARTKFGSLRTVLVLVLVRELRRRNMVLGKLENGSNHRHSPIGDTYKRNAKSWMDIIAKRKRLS